MIRVRESFSSGPLCSLGGPAHYPRSQSFLLSNLQQGGKAWEDHVMRILLHYSHGKVLCFINV